MNSLVWLRISEMRFWTYFCDLLMGLFFHDRTIWLSDHITTCLKDIFIAGITFWNERVINNAAQNYVHEIDSSCKSTTLELALNRYVLADLTAYTKVTCRWTWIWLNLMKEFRNSFHCCCMLVFTGSSHPMLVVHNFCFFDQF